MTGGKTSGGPAFLREGMSLRDYFAAEAMPHLLVSSPGEDWGPESVAKASYAIADAMLKERQK